MLFALVSSLFSNFSADTIWYISVACTIVGVLALLNLLSNGVSFMNVVLGIGGGLLLVIAGVAYFKIYPMRLQIDASMAELASLQQMPMQMMSPMQGYQPQMQQGYQPMPPAYPPSAPYQPQMQQMQGYQPMPPAYQPMPPSAPYQPMPPNNESVANIYGPPAPYQPMPPNPNDQGGGHMMDYIDRTNLNMNEVYRSR